MSIKSKIEEQINLLEDRVRYEVAERKAKQDQIQAEIAKGVPTGDYMLAAGADLKRHEVKVAETGMQLALLKALLRD